MKSFARLDRSMGNFRLWHLADIGVLANVRRHLRSFADQLLWKKQANGRNDDQDCAWFCLNSGHRTG
jgi:hypothetical protein